MLTSSSKTVFNGQTPDQTYARAPTREEREQGLEWCLSRPKAYLVYEGIQIIVLGTFGRYPEDSRRDSELGRFTSGAKCAGSLRVKFPDAAPT